MQESAKTNQEPNVQGFERFASVAGGLVLVGKGIRRGGFLGLVELAVGGLVLARGASGQCEMKRAMADMEAKEGGQDKDKERYSHMPMDSEVHSPDFENDAVTMPDATQMGNEARADRQSEDKASPQSSNKQS